MEVGFRPRRVAKLLAIQSAVVYHWKRGFAALGVLGVTTQRRVGTPILTRLSVPVITEEACTITMNGLRREQEPSKFCILSCYGILRPTGLTGGQARSDRAQHHHLVCCLVACCVLERARQDGPPSISQRKRPLSRTGRSLVLPALERRRGSASPLIR